MLVQVDTEIMAAVGVGGERKYVFGIRLQWKAELVELHVAGDSVKREARRPITFKSGGGSGESARVVQPPAISA